jgi:heterodisulfide reductase subunit A-like polyferredoxin
VVGVRGHLYIFWPDYFEMSSADYQWICIYLTIRIYGFLFEEVYKSIKKKEMMDENANFEEGKETKDGEKIIISDRDPVKSSMSNEVYILVHILLFSYSYLQI